MKLRPVLLLALLAASTTGFAADVSVEKASGVDALDGFTIVWDGHRIAAPKTEADQQGFEQVRVSADGRTVGWLADDANCCTSYPLPTVLVLWRGGQVLRRIPGVPPIFHWAFVPGSDEVVVQLEYPHGPEYVTYRRVDIATGQVLSEFRCDQDEKVVGAPPAWTRLVDRNCPNYDPAPSPE